MVRIGAAFDDFGVLNVSVSWSLKMLDSLDPSGVLEKAFEEAFFIRHIL